MMGWVDQVEEGNIAAQDVPAIGHVTGPGEAVDSAQSLLPGAGLDYEAIQLIEARLTV